jgi:signal transduction histidine kinase/PAS domain-containing protein
MKNYSDLSKDELIKELKSVKEALALADAENIVARKKLRNNDSVINKIEKLTRTYHWERDYAANTYTMSNIAAEVLGVYPENIVPTEKIWQLIAPKYVPVLAQYEQSEKIPNHVYEHEYEIRLHGQFHHFKANFTVHFDSNGTPTKEIGLWQDITEIKTREISLSEQNEVLQNVQKAAKIGHWKTNLKRNKVYLSPQLQLILGASTLVDENCEIDIDAFSSYYNVELVSRLAETKSQKVNEFNTVNIIRNFETNKTIHLYRKAQIQRDHSGNPKFVTGVAQDITDRVAAETKLSEVEYERSIILDSISTGVLLLDNDKTVLWSNPAISIILDKPSHKLIGKTVHNILLGKEPECDYCLVNQMLKGIPLNQTYHTAEGGKTIQIAGNPIYSTQGKVKGIVLTVDDITELMRKKNELSELNSKLAQTIDNLEFVNNISLDLIAKPEIKQTFDAILKHLLHKSNSSLVFAIRYDDENRKAIPIHFETGNSMIDTDALVSDFVNFAENIYNANHDVKDLMNITDIRNLDNYKDLPLRKALIEANVTSILVAPIIILNKVYGAIGICNFFEPKEWGENEIALIQASSNLVSLAIQRQTYENELIEQKHRAEESDKLKTAFLASISHEIRTPLNSIVGFTNLIVMDSNSQKYKDYYDVIKRNSDLLTCLIGDILDYSTMEAGIIQLKHEYCNITEICMAAVHSNVAQTQEGVTLRFIEPEQNIVMQTDRNKLSQVLNNIIGNAIKFTYAGTIDVSYVSTDKEITFFVKDTGVGIPKDKFDVIFERFIKLDQFIQGTGLGLTLVRNIINKMGGRIWVESTLGKGSVFFFSFPLHQ